jgi:hypothetical protein
MNTKNISKLVLTLVLVFAIPGIASTTAYAVEAPRNSLKANTENQIGGIYFITPINLSASNLAVSAEAKKLVKSMTSVKGVSGDLEITILVSEYQDGLQLNLDGAVKGSIDSVSNLSGVSDSKYTISDVRIKNAEGRRVSYQAKRRKVDLCTETVYILKGQRIWMFQALFQGGKPQDRVTVEKLLASIN